MGWLPSKGNTRHSEPTSLSDFTNPKVGFLHRGCREIIHLSLFQRLCRYDPAVLKLLGEMLLLSATIFSYKVLDSLETGEYIFRLTCECCWNKKKLCPGIHLQTRRRAAYGYYNL
jgi:hypothetical protein